MPSEPDGMTSILSAIEQGDPKAAEQLLPLVQGRESVSHESARLHIEQIRRDEFGIEPDGTKRPLALARHLRPALKYIAEELNAKGIHFILELLQNAEDNTYPEGVQPELSIWVEPTDPTQTGGDGCLCLLNNETGFTPEQVFTLCSLGQSKKVKKHGYIGEKGIGFKSVFRVTDQPHIFSKGYQFHFSKPHDMEDLGYIVPHWVPIMPSVVQPGNTAILLPLVTGKRAEISKELQALPPETILFLEKIRRLRLGKEHFIARDKTLGLVKLSAGGDESLYFVQRSAWQKPDGLFEEKRADIDERDVAVAFPLRLNHPFTGRVFAFLPTLVVTGLPFLVNADFLTSASRDSLLEDRPWNVWLRDNVAPSFTAAFHSLLRDPHWRKEAYRFLPLKSDILAGAEFFERVVDAVQTELKATHCVLTTAGDFDLPSKVHYAGASARRLLSEVPQDRAKVALLHQDLEPHWNRLKPLGSPTLSFAQLFEACNDADWLANRNSDWWETLFDLLVACDVKAETVGSFPILRCRDATCRPLSSGVFFDADHGQGATSNPICSDWPSAHFFDADLQSRFQRKPVVWAWLNGVAGIRPFSMQAYISGSLLNWMRGQTGERLFAATRFIAANFAQLDKPAQQMIKQKMPWLLANGQVVNADASGGREFVTPECLEGPHGWNRVFVEPADRAHFHLLSDQYVADMEQSALKELRSFFDACGVIDRPGPARIEEQSQFGQTRQNWRCPRWLRDMTTEDAKGRYAANVEAFENWLERFKENACTFLRVSTFLRYQARWDETATPSQFGEALASKAWLRTTRGMVNPKEAFLNKPDVREFYGDAVPYVEAALSEQLLERLGVRARLTAEALIGSLRQMSPMDNPDLEVLEKIYRRLQDSDFNADIFRQEDLIFLASPAPRWCSAKSLFWEDAEEVFDTDFGYVEQTYGKCELHRFFTEKLRIPRQPALKDYALVWRKLCSETTADRKTVERKLKLVLQRLADSQGALAGCDWWRELKPHLRVWTSAGRFESPAHVYVPDHPVAVGLFADHVQLTFPSKPTRAVARLLLSMGCRSLDANVRQKLAGMRGVSVRPCPICLTAPAKELCVYMICSHPGWKDHRSHLGALLETAEMNVAAITVDFSLHDDPQAGCWPQQRDAFWLSANGRLLLREGVDPETLRDAAASSIAAAFSDETDAKMQAEFFRLLTVSVERARKLIQERTNWQLSPDQQAWLRGTNWQPVITQLEEVEKPSSPRTIRAPALPTATPASAAGNGEGITVTATIDTPANAGVSRTGAHSGATTETSSAQAPGSTGEVLSPLPHETPADFRESSAAIDTAETDVAVSEPRDTSETDSKMTQAAPHAMERNEQEFVRSSASASSSNAERQTKSGSLPDLHDANSMSAGFVEVTARPRARRERRQSHQAAEDRREVASGLSGTTAESKKALEQRARDFAANKLKELGYTVTPMGQNSPGYDLLAVKPGSILKVEIKGHKGTGSRVFITRREWKEYLRTRDAKGQAWELWNVENVAKSSGKQPTIQRIRQIPKSALKESGYWIALNECSDQLPE